MGADVTAFRGAKGRVTSVKCLCGLVSKDLVILYNAKCMHVLVIRLKSSKICHDRTK